MRIENLKLYIIAVFVVFFTVSEAQELTNQFDNEGKRHGAWSKNFGKTDQKRYEGQFYHGKEIDTFKFYSFVNGKSVLSAVKIFNSDNNIADVTFYTSTKNVISKGKMDRKAFVGEWVYYHKNSKKKMISEQFNSSGHLNGKRLVFYKNGITAEDTFYKQGKLEGEAKWYSEQNKLIKVAHYKNDELDGEYITYNKAGKVMTKGSYQNGRRSGIWQLNEDGKSKTVDYNKVQTSPKKQ